VIPSPRMPSADGTALVPMSGISPMSPRRRT
jgi:hypothetical protein